MKSDEAAELARSAHSTLATLDAWLASLEKTGSADRYRGRLTEALSVVQGGFGHSPDVVVRRMDLPAAGCSVLVVAIQGLVQEPLLAESLFQPLLTTALPPDRWGDGVFRVVDVRPEAKWPSILSAIAAGQAAVFVEGVPYVWLVNVATRHGRGVQRPQTEISVRGPEDAFDEVVATQMALLRQRLLTPALRFVELSVGGVQATKIVVAYLDGVTNSQWVETAVERIRNLQVSGRPNATVVAGRIRDCPRSIFPTIRASERVDMAVWWLLEGKVLILVDGDPFVLSVPAPLPDFYRTAQDFGSSWVDASLSRCVRFAGWAMGLYLPALYIALTEVNPGLIPPALLIVIIGNHLGLPFPPVTEALIMVLVIEILREAAMRLPKTLGTTIGTVGAIVVGTAVVKAGLVSPQVIVVMTLTALAFFSTPVYELSGAWRLVGFVMMLTAAVLGLFGILLVTVFLVAELISMQSFGVPYLDPVAPLRAADLGATVPRPPWRMWTHRLTLSRRRQGQATPSSPAERP
jgi:spore germination protein KA